MVRGHFQNKQSKKPTTSTSQRALKRQSRSAASSLHENPVWTAENILSYLKPSSLSRLIRVDFLLVSLIIDHIFCIPSQIFTIAEGIRVHLRRNVLKIDPHSDVLIAHRTGERKKWTNKNQTAGVVTSRPKNHEKSSGGGGKPWAPAPPRQILHQAVRLQVLLSSPPLLHEHLLDVVFLFYFFLYI